MSPEQINLAIAEACGWTWVPHPTHGVGGYWECGMPGKYGYQRGDWGSKELAVGIPSYCTDLNEMARAEATLNDDQWDAYCDELGGSLRSCASAIACQRAEAFVRIIGKWKH